VGQKMTYTQDFETFWSHYPKRWNKDLGLRVKRKKSPAFQKWQKLSKDIRAKCLSRVHLIAKMEGNAVRDCVTWLNQEGWDDFEQEELKKMPIGLPKELIENLLKVVPDGTIDVNNERNKQMKRLKGKQL